MVSDFHTLDSNNFISHITLALAIEGWACWLMILPIFLIAASIGGLIGGYLKLKRRNDRLNISLLILIPFLISPVEQLIEKIVAIISK